MKKLLFIICLCLSLIGCEKKPEFTWELQTQDYAETVQKLPKDGNVVLVSRNEDLDTKEKYIQMDFYCQNEDIASVVILALNANKTEDDIKEGLIKATTMMGIEVDDYFKECMNDLEVSLNNEDFLDQIKGYYHLGKKAIITFKQGNITVQVWNDSNYTLVNGEKDNLNREMKAYANKYIELIEGNNQATINLKVNDEGYHFGLRTYEIKKEDKVFWEENGGLADSNPITGKLSLTIEKATLPISENGGVINFKINGQTAAAFPQDIYEKINPINSIFIWNQNLEFKENEEVVIGYQVLNQDKELIFSEDYYNNPELLKDYDVVMITLKLIK